MLLFLSHWVFFRVEFSRISFLFLSGPKITIICVCIFRERKYICTYIYKMSGWQMLLLFSNVQPKIDASTGHVSAQR